MLGKALFPPSSVVRKELKDPDMKVVPFQQTAAEAFGKSTNDEFYLGPSSSLTTSIRAYFRYELGT